MEVSPQHKRCLFQNSHWQLHPSVDCPCVHPTVLCCEVGYVVTGDLDLNVDAVTLLLRSSGFWMQTRRTKTILRVLLYRTHPWVCHNSLTFMHLRYACRLELQYMNLFHLHIYLFICRFQSEKSVWGLISFSWCVFGHSAQPFSVWYFFLFIINPHNSYPLICTGALYSNHKHRL